jgi:GNAT superfamily N-acetyltransferase
VSWSELLRGSAISHRPSPLESDRFGVEVDRLTQPLGAEVSTPDLLSQIARSAADVTVLRYPADRVELYAELLACGRTVLFADTLVYWRLAVGSGVRPAPDPGVTAISVPAGQGADARFDEALLDDLVGDIFRGYGSHYLANPLFDRARALAGYQEWARHSAQGDGLVVLRSGEEVVGLATVDRTDDVIEIELAGVRAAARGQGLYARLLAGVEDRAADGGSSEVLISTQGHNVRVQRAWSRYGFEPVAAFVTVHLVRSGLLSAH